MKKRLLLLPYLMLTLVACQAQTAGEIVDKYIEAMGGLEKINSIKSVSADFALKEINAEIPGQLTVVEGSAYKVELSVSGRKIIECYTQDGGWVLNSLWYTGLKKLSESENNLMKDKLHIQPLALYRQRGGTLELVGKEGNNYIIMYTQPDGIEVSYLIDSKTYYIYKETRFVKKDGALTELSAVIFEDYRKTPEGYMMAYTQHVSGVTGPPLLTFVVKNIVFNQTIDNKIFNYGNQRSDL